MCKDSGMGRALASIGQIRKVFNRRLVFPRIMDEDERSRRIQRTYHDGLLTLAERAYLKELTFEST